MAKIDVEIEEFGSNTGTSITLSVGQTLAKTGIRVATNEVSIKWKRVNFSFPNKKDVMKREWFTHVTKTNSNGLGVPFLYCHFLWILLFSSRSFVREGMVLFLL